MFTLGFNPSIHIETNTNLHITSDAGVFLTRSILDQAKILDFLITGFEDLDTMLEVTAMPKKGSFTKDEHAH